MTGSNRPLFGLLVAAVASSSSLVKDAAAQDTAACITDVPKGYASLDDQLLLQWRGGLTFSDVESGRIILVGFGKEEDALRPEHQTALAELAERLTAEGVADYSIRRMVGGASQTGPEPDNVELSRTRADRVAQFLHRAGVEIEGYEYFGSERPLLDLAGAECAVNRYVVLQYDLCRNAERPIQREVLVSSVEEEFEALQRLSDIPESERSVAPDMEMSIRRCNVKTRYLLGRSYETQVQRLQSGRRLPPPEPNSPAYFALGFVSEDEGQRPRQDCRGSVTETTEATILLEQSRTNWLHRGTTRAVAEAGDFLEESLGTSRFALWHAPAYRDRLAASHHQRCRQDIYYRYTYCGPEAYDAEDGSTRYQWPEDWRAEADAIERRVFGEVTDCAPSENWWDALWRER